MLFQPLLDRQNNQFELQRLYVQYFMSMQKLLLTLYVYKSAVICIE